MAPVRAKCKRNFVDEIVANFYENLWSDDRSRLRYAEGQHRLYTVAILTAIMTDWESR